MAKTGELLKQYSQRIDNRRPISDLRAEEEARYNLPTRRENLQNINRTILETSKLLDNVDEDVASRAIQLGGPVTEAARRRLTSATAAPIQERLTGLGRDRSMQEVGLNESESLVGQMLGDRLQEMWKEDDSLLARIDREMAREAAQREEEYRQRQLELQQQQINASRYTGPNWKQILDMMGYGEGGSKSDIGNVDNLVVETNPLTDAKRASASRVDRGAANAGDAITNFRNNPSLGSYWNVVKKAPEIGKQGAKGILDWLGF